MNRHSESTSSSLVHHPKYLPWYFHVGLMVFMLVTAYFMLAKLGGGIFLVVGSAISPGIMLAVAGKGNRWLFSAIFFLASALGLALIVGMPRFSDMTMGLVPCLLWCIGVSLWPALLLWIAHSLNRCRQGRAATETNVTDTVTDA
ncbi:hypothetical protein [Massilia sp. CCM 8734]|uniref:hypothetical protein n=1 Tax=Massilia sp. CCM 8734 TaxID=2609283 RepID=UPI00141F71AE|nr:hypothetical protein [Massilia sp. CCM 8734]NHZ94140.1 hypothetical protein [Massilia sp. CCM 8734]